MQHFFIIVQIQSVCSKIDGLTTTQKYKPLQNALYIIYVVNI